MTLRLTRSPLHPAPWLGAGLLALAFAGGVRAEEPAAAPAAAEEAPPKITLKWTTASEVDNYGYFVFRGDTIDGPFQQVNAKAIPGAGNSETPTNYVWEDTSVELGKTYYYYLESISVQGVREKFSPVLSRRCCLKPGETKPAEKPQAEAAPEGETAAKPAAEAEAQAEATASKPEAAATPSPK